MKKNSKGFFLAETIVMVALVTTVIAFVYPNVSKIYSNYKNQALYYDQTEDLYFLKQIYEINKDGSFSSTANCSNWHIASGKKINTNTTFDGFDNYKNVRKDGDYNGYMHRYSFIGNITKDGKYYTNFYVYILDYMGTYSSDNYNFNKYLKRMKKTTNDPNAERLVGVFKISDGTTRYASIKINKIECK